MALEAAEEHWKNFLQGLKPVCFRNITPGLKPRTPKEKESLRSLLGGESFELGKNEIGNHTQGYRQGAPFQSEIVAARERNNGHEDRSAHYVRESRLSPGNSERVLRFRLDFAKFPCSKHGQDSHQAAQPDINRE
jgi:hypothetical protein